MRMQQDGNYGSVSDEGEPTRDVFDLASLGKHSIVVIAATLLVLGVLVACVMSFTTPRTVGPLSSAAPATDAAASATPDGPTPVQLEGPKINVGIYYEVLCEFCAQFITKVLTQAWGAFGVKDIVKLEFVPFGNADSVLLSDESYNFTCQHGPKECRSNMFQACIVRTVKSIDKQLDYIVCLEKSKDPVAAEEHCAKVAKADYQVVQTCFQNEGNAALREMQLKTVALSPAKRGVPWITIGGEHLENVDQFLDTVCKRYKGVQPLGCLFVEKPELANSP